ncbi:hypothetical protein B5G52_00505 [Pseudoalteromonas sp. A601]|uniref:hypothetical protein n=1 Tax=Pseudoalteromonas sp. A601 TaxID=1967839 RepID=UPI000B3C9317|nr:hypothetical protein [Pseudoalteromonas sp. A601]OUS74526.1 hypothetical protein B5G52_00505 [Pseudoalteromonas sp. A601]
MLIRILPVLVLSSLLPFSVIAKQSCGFTKNNNQPLNDSDWRYATDPHGSTASIKKALLHEEQVWIAFNRVPRVDAKNNSWVELIYDLVNKTLADQSSIMLEYKSSTDLVVKLSQQDYGSEGDKSYAHYQYTLPAQTHWQTKCINLSDFSRPSWTPSSSVDKGIIKEHVSAVYLVPDLKDALGGKAVVAVKNISIGP